MANIKSQKKRNRTNELRRQRNASVTSRVKTIIKKTEQTFEEEKNATAIDSSLREALSEIDKAAAKGVFHAKAAGRKKSTLQRKATAAKSA